MNSYGKPNCKISVWKKGEKIIGLDSKIWRKDIFGNKINFDEHGKTTQYGWDIDHYIPKAKGGSDDIMNLFAVHYIQNRSMGMSMEQKDKMFWFRALEEKKERQEKRELKKEKKREKVILNIGDILFVKQTPITESQPAIIKDIDKKNNKVLVYWIYSDYKEKIELYEPLFERKRVTREKREEYNYI